MAADTICKTIHQYNREQVSPENMKKLQEIADDYKKVKNYVYQRYGGIAGLPKIYPGYTVQNEMTESGLRTELGLPSVYFYLAVFDALADIRSQWTKTKAQVSKLVRKNDNLTQEEKHYLRFLLKVSNAFEAVLNQTAMRLPKNIQAQHDLLAGEVDSAKLHRYLCRQVRKYHMRQRTDKADGFSASERAYRYADHGIYISIKEKRKRIFVPLTDNNQYRSQLYIKLYPERGDIEVKVPIQVDVHAHEDYKNHTAIALGMQTMFTTDKGRRYGEGLGQMQSEYAKWLREQTGIYQHNREHNPGRKKYTAKKRRYEERVHSYINHELNRFFQTEKPQAVYIVKLPKPDPGGANRRVNHFVNTWQRGYIRRRLELKCQERAVALVEVLGKDIAKECSQCGGIGNKKDGVFSCAACGYTVEEKTNTARNILKRGMGGKTIH